MSGRELERGSVLERVQLGSIDLGAAASLLGLSYRQTRRVNARYKAHGGAGLVHRGAGRPSNRSHPSAEREMVMSLIRKHYGGKKERGPHERFGPTLVAEHLWTDHGVLVAVRTLMRWMIDDGLWSRARKTRSVKHPRRERKARFGDLIQLDGSFHDWLEGRGGMMTPCLMTMVDDATGLTLLSFEDHETTWAATRVLRAWIGEYGIPRALYTDWRNVYKRLLTAGERARGESEAFTQFGRMCEKLGITIIAASSPQ
ncbi:MAG: ISNCY family transposase, partial [Gemmatimonadaceae bacterium]